MKQWKTNERWIIHLFFVLLAYFWQHHFQQTKRKCQMKNVRNKNENARNWKKKQVSKQRQRISAVENGCKLRGHLFWNVELCEEFAWHSGDILLHLYCIQQHLRILSCTNTAWMKIKPTNGNNCMQCQALPLSKSCKVFGTSDSGKCR